MGLVLFLLLLLYLAPWRQHLQVTVAAAAACFASAALASGGARFPEAGGRPELVPAWCVDDVAEILHKHVHMLDAACAAAAVGS
jgi:hypothetical protein